MPPEVALFAGPSAHGLSTESLQRNGTTLLPPVRRGDIDRLVNEKAAGVAVVCDGIFHEAPAVSHAELCRAIDAGWQVWGVSSIGAIRAFELRMEGMLGYGYVHAQFTRYADFTDDELCLLHFPEMPYFPVSEALVNVRFALEQRKSSLGISDRSESRLLEALRGLWFGERTEERILSLMLDHAGVQPWAADQLLRWLATHRIKMLDLAAILADRPWLDPFTLAAPAQPGPTSTSGNRVASTRPIVPP